MEQGKLVKKDSYCYSIIINDNLLVINSVKFESVTK